MKKDKIISTDDFIEIIVKTIQDEPFFSTEVLIPKIRALATVFRFKISGENFSKVEKPSDTARLIRANEVMNKELTFFKNKLRKIVSEEKMKSIFNELEDLRNELNLNQ